MINQTYMSWELILVDDGSTDDSGKICDSFCFDPRISVIHQDNRGAFISRIKGVETAKGEYGLGLDADDYLDACCLERIKKAADVSRSDLIFFGFRYVGRQRGTVKCTLAPGKKYSKKEILEEVITTTNHSLWDKAIKLEKLKRADYRGMKRKLSINLDYAQIIPILCNIENGYVIGDVLYNYRVCGESISHSCKVQHIFDTGLVTGFVIRKLEENGMLDGDIYNKIHIAYLKMISHRLLRLFYNGKISKEDCARIRGSKVYRNSRQSELWRNLDRHDFTILKLFRYKLYWGLELMAKTQAGRLQ